jgi:hypothetical protein
VLNVRTLLCGIVAALALALPAAAGAAWFEFWVGDIAPNSNRHTSQTQQRYAKLMDWQVSTRCTKTWYRNQNSSVDYYIVLDCQAYSEDDRNSSTAAWGYCRNESDSYTIWADCYTCINEPNACP